MSSIGMVSCFTFHPSAKPSEIVLESMKLTGHAKSPEHSLITLYGFRDALEELSALRNAADAKGIKFCSVAIDLDVGNLPSSLNSKDLETTRFINLRRISRELETIVINKFRSYVKADGGDEKLMETRHFEYLIEYPEYISRLHDEPEFAHIDAFAFPVRLGKQTLQRVALFDPKNIVSMVAKTYPEIKVSLPNVFKQTKSISL